MGERERDKKRERETEMIYKIVDISSRPIKWRLIKISSANKRVVVDWGGTISVKE